MIRARIFKNGWVWSFAVLDADGIPFVVGHVRSWDEARDAVVKELTIFDQTSDEPPLPPLVSPKAAERSWVARVLGVAA